MTIAFARCTTPVLASALALGIAPAAWAQDMTAKDAWEALNAFVDGTGGQLRATGIVRDGDILVAEGVVLRSGEAPAAVTVTMPELRILPAEGGFTLAPAPVFDLALASGGMAETRSYTVTHDGSLLLSLSAAQIGLGLDFGRFEVSQTGATRNGRPLEEQLTALLQGFTGQIDLTLAEPFDLNGVLQAASMTYSFNLNDTDFMPIRQTGTSETADVRLTFGARGLALLEDEAPGGIRRAFEQGFEAGFNLTTGAATGEVDQTIGSQNIAMTLAAAGSEFRLDARGGIVEMGGTATGYDVSVRTPQASGDVRLGSFGMSLSLPVVSTADDVGFAFRLNLDELTVSDGLLAPIGASSFAGEVASLALDLRGNGRWLVEITEEEGETDMPATFSSIDLVELATRIGPSALTGGGSFAFTPGTFGQGDVPDGTGDFTFELVGGEALLNRLGAAGILPPDQQFLARMMLNGLGRPVGADHLRSEIAIRPGNQITVNGAPLPF